MAGAGVASSVCFSVRSTLAITGSAASARRVVRTLPQALLTLVGSFGLTSGAWL